jgi:hypothetical protein
LRNSSYTRTYLSTTNLVYNLAPISFEAGAVLLQVLIVYLLLRLFKAATAERKKKGLLRLCWFELGLFFGCSRIEVLILVNVQLNIPPQYRSPFFILSSALLALILLSSIKIIASFKKRQPIQLLLFLSLDLRYLVYPCCFLLAQNIYLQLVVPIALNVAIILFVLLMLIRMNSDCSGRLLMVFVLY